MTQICKHLPVRDSPSLKTNWITPMQYNTVCTTGTLGSQSNNVLLYCSSEFRARFPGHFLTPTVTISAFLTTRSRLLPTLSWQGQVHTEHPNSHLHIIFTTITIYNDQHFYHFHINCSPQLYSSWQNQNTKYPEGFSPAVKAKYFPEV